MTMRRSELSQMLSSSWNVILLHLNQSSFYSNLSLFLHINRCKGGSFGEIYMGVGPNLEKVEINVSVYFVMTCCSDLMEMLSNGFSIILITPLINQRAFR